MLTAFLLTTALVSGQAAPVAPMAPPAPASSAPNGKAKTEDCPPAEEEKPATKYFVEKLLEGSRAGCLLNERGIKVFGWTSGNYTGSSNTGSNLPVAYNDFGNGGQMNQNWLEVSKAIETSKQERQWGFRYATILPGTDSRFTIARGLGDPNSGDYPIDPMTFGYIEHFNPCFGPQGTTLRVGKWGSPIGYEVIDIVNTPFVSRSYLFLYNPFTHTGVQATTQMNDNLSVYYGVVTGADVFIDPAGTATFLGGFKYAPKEGKNSFGVNVMINNANFNTSENFANYDSFNAIFTHTFSEQTSYVLDATYSFINDAPGVGNANWYGFANYFIHKHSNEKVTSTLRLEIFEDSEGFRTGFNGTYYEATYGIAWQACDAFIVRPFARYDYNRSGPWQGDNSLYTGGIELIARW